MDLRELNTCRWPILWLRMEIIVYRTLDKITNIRGTPGGAFQNYCDYIFQNYGKPKN